MHYYDVDKALYLNCEISGSLVKGSDYKERPI